jgi:hypothetical protein
VGRVFRLGVVRVGDLSIAERASCESERGRGALSYGPRTSRDAVEASRRGCLVRVGVGTRSRCPVEPASCESERGRGVLSAVFGFVVDSVSFFFIVGCGYPYYVGTDTMHLDIHPLSHNKCTFRVQFFS